MRKITAQSIIISLLLFFVSLGTTFGGEADLRTQMGQSEEYYRALKKLKKEILLVRMPDEYHGWRRPSHRLLQQLYLIAWFEKYRTKSKSTTN